MWAEILILLVIPSILLGNPQLPFDIGALLSASTDMKGSSSDSNGVWVPVSPCVHLFHYRWWGSDVIGAALIPPPVRYSSTEPIKVIITLALDAVLPNNYVGTLELHQDKEVVFSRLEKGDPTPIFYRVRFPLRSPIPILTKIEVNDNVICEGPTPQDLSVMTILSLDHTLFPGSTGLIPNPAPVPVISRPPWQQPHVPQRPQTPARPQTPRPWVQPVRPALNPPSQVVQPAQPEGIGFVSTSRPTIQQTIGHSSEDECGQVIKVAHLVQHGKPTERGNWPWLAAIFVKTNVGQDFQCGGSLISNSHVITAAHCVKEPNSAAIGADGITVYLGKFNLRKAEANSQQRDVSRIALHPSYGSGKYDNDVAIIFLDTPAQITVFVRPVCLWSNDDTSLETVIHQRGTVVGWGRDERGNRVSDEPKMVQMPLVTQEECLRSHQNFFYLTTEKTYCAGGRDGSGPCNGDSGGGMYFPEERSDGNKRWTLRGVVSLSLQDENTKQCDLRNYIVFTDVAKFTSWIRTTMRTF